MMTNRVAVVTGASRGIGNAIAAKLADEGYAIIAVGTSDMEKVAANLQNIRQAGNRFAYAQADVSTDAGRQSIIACALEKFGRIDVLVNNAGVAPKIVNISSISAYTSSTMRAEYCISKAAISMVTQLFADRLADEGINVYEIRPGIINTDMTSVVKEKYDALIANGLTPIKRWGQPVDVANAVSVVCSGMLNFSTGEVINVDGGFHIRRL